VLTNIEITNLKKTPLFLNEMKAIFFETSSRKNFNSEIEKENFWNKWTQFYINKCPEFVFFAVSENKLLGYLTGSLYSNEENSYKIFSDLFEKFPAHLHVNCTQNAQGQGVGTALVNEFFKYVKVGCHIVTLKREKNVEFYKKCGFTFTCERENLFFMGANI